MTYNFKKSILTVFLDLNYVLQANSHIINKTQYKKFTSFYQSI